MSRAQYSRVSRFSQPCHACADERCSSSTTFTVAARTNCVMSRTSMSHIYIHDDTHVLTSVSIHKRCIGVYMVHMCVCGAYVCICCICVYMYMLLMCVYVAYVCMWCICVYLVHMCVYVAHVCMWCICVYVVHRRVYVAYVCMCCIYMYMLHICVYVAYVCIHT